MRRIGLVMRRMHITATAAHSRQRALRRSGRTDMPCVPEFWLPNLRNIRIVLYPTVRYAIRILSDLPRSQTNRNG